MSRKHAILIIFGIFSLISIISVVLFINKNSEQAPVKDREKLLEELKSLPYLKFVKEDQFSKKKRGVTLYDKKLSYQGLNLYNNHLDLPSGAYLIDMRGKILHKWIYKEKMSVVWRFMEVASDGSIIVLLRSTNPGLIKLDWNSNLQFSLDGDFHHDVAISDDGTVYALLDAYSDETGH